MDVTLVGFAVVASVVLGIIALIVLYFTANNNFSKNIDQPKNLRNKNASIVIVIGSGGHTSEILSLVKCLGPRYSPRYYVMANTDKMSEEKVLRLESDKNSKTEKDQFRIYKIPRSREVKQSWLTTILSTAYSCLISFPLVFKLRPEILTPSVFFLKTQVLTGMCEDKKAEKKKGPDYESKLCIEFILCNGPGTCIPLCFAGLILKIGFYPVKIIYVESICRVETLSLSGKILYHLADCMFVQWKQLQEKYPKTQYIGRIV